MKKCKSTSNTDEVVDEKRRKSLLPWNRSKADIQNILNHILVYEKGLTLLMVTPCFDFQVQYFYYYLFLQPKVRRN